MDMSMGMGLGSKLARSQGVGVYVPDFYADSVNGNDGNDGLSAETAFQTLAALQAAALAFGTGVRIGLLAGSHWREDLDLTSLANKTVQGVGDIVGLGLPLIDGSYVNVATWQTSADRADANTNVYSIALNQTFAEGYISCWDAGVKPQWRASIADVQANAGSFHIGGTSTDGKTFTGTRTLYFHPADSSNPNTNGRTVEITDPTRYGALRLGEGVIRLVHTRRNMYANGSLEGRGLAEGVLVSAGVKHEALFNNGIYRKCIGWHVDNDWRTNNIVLEFFVGDGSGLSNLYQQCAVRGPAPFGVTNSVQVVVAFSGHNSATQLSAYDRQDIVDCSAELCATAFGGEMLTGDITRVYTKNCGQAAAPVVYATSGVMTDCYFHYDLTLAGALRPFGGSGMPFAVDGLRVYIAGAPTLDGVFFNPPDHVVTGSVFVLNTEDAFSFLFGNLNAARTYSFSTSIVENRKNNVLLYQVATTGPTLGANHDNVYYDGSSTGYLGAQKDNVLRNNMPAYLAAYPESGTVTSNPGLVDPANGDFATVSPLANGAGLVRPSVTYMPIPATIEDAEAWIIANVG